MARGSKKKGGSFKWPAAVRKQPPSPLTLKDAYETGRIVFEHFDQMSNREIVDREKLTITKLTLHRCCAAYRVLQNLKYTPESCPFGFGVAARLDLVEEKYQAALAKRTVDEGLSTQRLELHIAQLRQKHPRSAGKQPMPRFERALGRLAPFTDGHFNLVGDLERVSELSEEKRGQLQRRAAQLRAELERVEKALSASRGTRSGSPRAARADRAAPRAPARRTNS
ncbi:MAG: hypothetical protein KIT72_07905 [Polyangiaceae bacterium]|nr:hypothetical protein [Polyangiaceae bacterium]MCW5790329.1 hypothetical protein [Polyangiaceae bacterium]